MCPRANVDYPPLKPDVVAQAILRLSARRDQPFEILNCADLTRELLRSELFGHERGAFAGAVNRSIGLVHRLDGGTLFMDEIGELALDAQAMLLRFLKAGEGRAVGASRSFTTDVRVIAATHRDLEAGVEQGTFREDVYTRCGARSSKCLRYEIAGSRYPLTPSFLTKSCACERSVLTLPARVDHQRRSRKR